MSKSLSYYICILFRATLRADVIDWNNSALWPLTSYSPITGISLFPGLSLCLYMCVCLCSCVCVVVVHACMDPCVCVCVCVCVCQRQHSHWLEHWPGNQKVPGFDAQLHSVAVVVSIIARNFTHIAPVYLVTWHQLGKQPTQVYHHWVPVHVSHSE